MVLPSKLNYWETAKDTRNEIVIKAIRRARLDQFMREKHVDNSVIGTECTFFTTFLRMNLLFYYVKPFDRNNLVIIVIIATVSLSHLVFFSDCLLLLLYYLIVFYLFFIRQLLLF